MIQTSRPYRGGVLPLSRLVRQTNRNNNIDLLNIMYDQTQDPETNMGLLSQDTLTPYSSTGVVNLMRAVSGNVTLGAEDVTQRIY